MIDRKFMLPPTSLCQQQIAGVFMSCVINVSDVSLFTDYSKLIDVIRFSFEPRITQHINPPPNGIHFLRIPSLIYISANKPNWSVNIFHNNIVKYNPKQSLFDTFMRATQKKSYHLIWFKTLIFVHVKQTIEWQIDEVNSRRLAKCLVWVMCNRNW